MLSPIALFAYNRKNHLNSTIQALQDCNLSNQSDLFLFIDGPPVNATASAHQAIQEVKDFAKNISGFKSLTLIERPSNLGLAQSILQGITQVLQQHQSIIVLEDDMLVGKDFLLFMNEALKQYENVSTVAGISGYSFPIQETKPYFTRTGSCWGWATYKRVWDDFISNRSNLNLDLIDVHERELFNVYDAVYSTMFLQLKQGLIQSWAIEFYVYYFSKKQFFLMPGFNQICNVGFDGSGSHQKHGNFLTDNNSIVDKVTIVFPIEIVEEKPIRTKIQKLYAKGYAKPSKMISFVNKIKSVLLGNEKNNH